MCVYMNIEQYPINNNNNGVCKHTGELQTTLKHACEHTHIDAHVHNSKNSKEKERNSKRNVF